MHTYIYSKINVQSYIRIAAQYAANYIALKSSSINDEIVFLSNYILNSVNLFSMQLKKYLLRGWEKREGGRYITHTLSKLLNSMSTHQCCMTTLGIFQQCITIRGDHRCVAF